MSMLRMMRRRAPARVLPLAGLLVAAQTGLATTPSTEQVDWNTVNRIRAEEFNHSQVGDTLEYLSDVIGPRLTGSPQLDQARAWVRGKLTSWGLVNARDEVYEEHFGRGWTFRSAGLQMLAPRQQPLYALPRAWTPGTQGPLEGDAELLVIKTKEDLEKHHGQLMGKILLVDPARTLEHATQPDFQRQSAASLGELQTFQIPDDGQRKQLKTRREEFLKREDLVRQVNPLLVQEGVLAVLHASAGDNGILLVAGGGSRKAGESPGVPDLVVGAEQYNQLVRLLEHKVPVRLQVAIDGGFINDTDQPAYDTVAEIPGTGPKARELVLIGAHLDSWHSATGATDNGAGVAAVMEAARLLVKLELKPRRTIRVVLWTGEEQGLLGSAGYVSRHFASRPEPTDPKEKLLPAALRENKGPLQLKPEYDKVAAYFNLDNGTGRIRGIYTQENAAVVPIFKAWLEPFNDVGATVVSLRNTGGTDHQSFDRVGLPGFQFVQDPMDYRSHTHHTTLDTFDHVSVEDLKQAAAIIAAFTWQAAIREEKLPRKPLVDD